MPSRCARAASAQSGAGEQGHQTRQRESQILADIVAAIGCEPDFRVWRNNVGLAVQGTRKVRYGLAVGSSDLIGVLAPSGRIVSLECKTDIGRLSEPQRIWLRVIRNLGGFACVVRSSEEARAALARARLGASE